MFIGCLEIQLHNLWWQVGRQFSPDVWLQCGHLVSLGSHDLRAELLQLCLAALQEQDPSSVDCPRHQRDNCWALWPCSQHLGLNWKYSVCQGRSIIGGLGAESLCYRRQLESISYKPLSNSGRVQCHLWDLVSGKGKSPRKPQELWGRLSSGSSLWQPSSRLCWHLITKAGHWKKQIWIGVLVVTSF